MYGYVIVILSGITPGVCQMATYLSDDCCVEYWYSSKKTLLPGTVTH